jgi:aspartate--ammonia ligase
VGWERVIMPTQRNLEFLKSIVRTIYSCLLETENHVRSLHPQIEPILPEKIHFVHTEDLQEMYPDLTPKQREDKAAKEYGAVFVIGIGGELADGKIHDGRAPDYDDWTTPTLHGKKGLNGDILLWYPLLNRAFEISSMGIRVDKTAMLKQLEIRNELHRKISIGTKDFSMAICHCQSAVVLDNQDCMFLLRKMHVGEVHSSIWPQDIVDKCNRAGIRLL